MIARAEYPFNSRTNLCDSIRGYSGALPTTRDQFVKLSGVITLARASTLTLEKTQ